MIHGWETQRSGPDDIIDAKGPHAEKLNGKRALAITPIVIPDFIPQHIKERMMQVRANGNYEIVNCDLCGSDGYVGPRLKWMKEHHNDTLYVCCDCLMKNCGGKMPKFLSMGGE